MGLFFFLPVLLSHVSSLLSLMVNDLYLLGKLAWSHKTLRANSGYQISIPYGNAHDISRDFVKFARSDTGLACCSRQGKGGT
jgi:hypothetical protein